MSHFSFTRAGGTWSAGLPILHGELQDFDAKTTAAINGDGGGTWAPSAIIIIGGAGLAVTTSLSTAGFEVTGDATFDHNVVINTNSNTFTNLATSTIFAGGSVSIGGATTWTFNSAPTFVAGFTSAGATHINSTLTVSGAATFESTALVEGGLTVLGNASLTSLTVSGPSTFTGATAFNTEATFSAGLISLFGDFLQRVTAVRGFNKRPIVVSAPTASADYAVNDMYLLRPGGSAQTITIVDGNDGDVLEFSVYGDAGTHTATINNPASATLAVLAYTTPTGGRGVSCRIGRIAGTYYVFDIVPFIA